MKPQILAFLCMAVSSPAWSAAATPDIASVTSLFSSPLPSGCKATLHFAREKVAAGGIPNDCHQSEFWIEVRDAKGKPRSGVAVDLPLITKGGQGPSYEDKAPDDTIKARLEWLPSTLRVKSLASLLPSPQGITGSDGRARGRFTSGVRTQKVEFSIVGGTKASILQVWNELEDRFDDDDSTAGGTTRVCYTMRFLDGNKWVPITGHHLYLSGKSVRFSVTDPTLGPDEDGDGKPDGLSDTVTYSEENPETLGWKAWLSWTKFGTLSEVEPGVYVGYYETKVPEETMLEGRTVDGVDNLVYDVNDHDAWEDR